MTKREDMGNDKDLIKKNSHVDLRKIKIQDQPQPRTIKILCMYSDYYYIHV